MAQSELEGTLDTDDEASAEARRLAVLAAHEVMDTPPDPALDTLTGLVSRLLDMPVGLVSLVDDHRQWFKSRHGLDVSQTPREIAFCDYVVRSGEAMVVEDAAQDPRFCDNPLVTGEPHVRFYAGVPLRVPPGEVLGTLCAIDHRPRTLDDDQLRLLHELGTLVVQQLMLHQRERALQSARSELQEHYRFFENSRDLNCVASTDGHFLELNPRWTEVLGYAIEELMAEPFLRFVHPEDQASTLQVLADLGSDRDVKSFRNRYRCKDGSYRWLEWTAHPAGRGKQTIFASARDVSEAVASEQALQFRNGILALITDAQTRFIADGADADAAWWDFLLERLLTLTGSEYGFIGVTESDDDGLFLRTKAITNIAWDDDTRRFYDEHAPAGMVFRNMKTLFGRAMLSQERYLSNDVAHDPHAGGRPAGHPPLNAFAGLPIKDGEQMVGLVGLANRDGGYAEELVQSLDPLLAFLGKVLNELALRAQQRNFLAQLEAAKELQDRVLEASETGFLALAADGSIALANRRVREMLPTLRVLEAHDAGPRGLDDAIGAIFADPHACEWALALRDAVGPGVLGPRKVRLRDALEASATVEVTVTRFRQDADKPAGLLLAMVDLRQRAALEDSLRRNASLEERVNQLRQQQRENEILSECVEYLQRCSALDEGMELVGRSLERLFPTANIVLYAERDGTMTLHRRVTRFGGDPALQEIAHNQCWALRTGRAYGSWPGGHHLACQHAHGDDPGPTYCVPLFTLERNVALFSVAFPHDEGRVAADTSEARMAQFVAMSQSVSGALSTIALRESLQRMALVDELTDLSNRRAFELEVNRNIASHRRSDRAFALAIVDVDHFKSVNDQHGHDAGDRVLQQVAKVLKGCVREGDLVARIGGEEFALFLSGLDSEVAQQRLEAMLDRLRDTPILPERVITASVGFIHAVDCDADIRYEALNKLADTALYQAKESGRDRVVRALAGEPCGEPESQS